MKHETKIEIIITILMVIGMIGMVTLFVFKQWILGGLWFAIYLIARIKLENMK